MISPRQAYIILSLAGLLTSTTALPQAISSAAEVSIPAGEIPTSVIDTTAVPTTIVAPTTNTGAPFPTGGSTTILGSGTGTAPAGTGPTGTGTTPISTGTPSTPGKSKLAVWWGQSPKKVDLDAQCADENVDIVILSFVTKNGGAGGMPTFNINTAPGPSEAQKAAGATDLIDGSSYVDAIKKCQSAGKKVYISLGGQTGEVEFKNKEEAETFADQIFNLFLGGKDDKTKDLRPFGDVILDGVDFDMESKTPAHYEEFTDKLRANMDSDSATEYKIAAAPQCPRTLDKDGGKIPEGDNSIPDAVLTKLDQVWIQFYNNPSCEHNATDTKGFMDSVQAWSKAIGDDRELWVGAPGSEDGAGSGYLEPADMEKEIAAVKDLKLANFAGYALWDGPEAINNDNYDAVIKKALA